MLCKLEQFYYTFVASRLAQNGLVKSFQACPKAINLM